jgi:hypothetical protein
MASEHFLCRFLHLIALIMEDEGGGDRGKHIPTPDFFKKITLKKKPRILISKPRREARQASAPTPD